MVLNFCIKERILEAINSPDFYHPLPPSLVSFLFPLPASSSFLLLEVSSTPAGPTLTYFHLQILIQEKVAELEVPVNNPVSVQILAAKDNLPKVVAGFGLGQCFSPLVQLQERLSGGRRGGMGSRYRGTGRVLSLKAAQDAPHPAFSRTVTVCSLP